jgi:hypothetical protein
MSNEHGTAQERDVATLRRAFDAGARLTKELAKGMGMTERGFRAAVRALRLTGYPVISESAQGSTYRKAETRAELEHFMATEIHPRAVDLLEQEYQLKQHADDHFPTIQERLIA